MNSVEFPRRSSDSEERFRDVSDAERALAPVQRGSILAHYLSIVFRRKWTIVAVIVGAMLVSLLLTLLTTPLYTASSLIEIQRESKNFTQVEGVQSTERSAIDMEFYQTQYGLMESTSLADRVATELRLYDDAKFFKMFNSGKLKDWFENGRLLRAKSTREQRVREAGNLLLKRFEVNPKRLSRLVEISFTSPDPEFSKRVVDAWGSNFIKVTLERRFEATSYARGFLEERLTQLRAKIDESERSLVAYAAKEGIVNLPATTPATGETQVSGERSLVADDLAALSRELSKATAERISAQSRLSGSGDTTAEALSNDAINTLRGRRAELSAEYARMMRQFEPQYPPALQLQTQIQQLDRSITREETRVSATLRSLYNASSSREQQLQARVEQLKASLLDLRRRSIQYNIFERDVDTNRELYRGLLQRYKEIGVAGGVGVNNISVVDASELPRFPSSPNLVINLALALILGLALGVGIALALEQLDEGIADPAEIEEFLNMPLLGILPKVDGGSPVEAILDPKSALAEAFLSFQTNLGFTSDHGIPRSIAITSSRPAEGKSTTSYALAHALSRSGRRTILIDGDMRSPSAHQLFGFDNNVGLSNYLSGENDLTKLVKPTNITNLSVMCAGPHPPSAGELLSGTRLGRMFEELAQHFDHVVIDAPPVMGLADAPLIGGRAEATIFVIEGHGTRRSTARVAVSRLLAANVQVIGAVLTKFDVKRAHYGYGYDYGYGYGYGANEKNTSQG
ncbi:MAG: polysaccharide biosynthesis tyrosine autokinase [Sphingomonadales bacterium]|nr:MAG: polysaccharide biosynthesis tyrosine autokinase [Sphingomonadales bacterium]